MSDSTGSDRKRRRVVTRLAVLLGAGTLALTGYVLRDAVLETWYLHQLGSTETETHLAAVEGLAQVGGSRSVDPLLRICLEAQPGKKGELPELVTSAITALTQVVPRAGAPHIEKVIRAFSAIAEKTRARIDLLYESMEQLGSRDGRVMKVVCELLTEEQARAAARATSRGWRSILTQCSLLDLAIRGFVGAWTTDRARGEEFLLAADLPGVVAFLRREGGLPGGILWAGMEREISRPLTGYRPGAAPTAGRAIAEFLRTEHGDEKVRAAALSFLPTTSWASQAVFEPSALAVSYRDDASPLVRAAALRLAGFFGFQPSTVDLAAVIESENDTRLLTEALRARTLWATETISHGLELWDGFRCDWLPHINLRASTPWSDAEITRLHEILATERDASLRDTASFALACRYRDLPRNRKSAPKPVHAAGLAVHEWGVWLDQQGSTVSPESVISELPDFVHRSQTHARDIWTSRTYSPMSITKPVVFFHSPRPLSLLVDVELFEGRPWTYYPKRSRYTIQPRQEHRFVSVSTPRGQPDETIRGPSAADLPEPISGEAPKPPAVEHRAGFRPPWVTPPARAEASAGVIFVSRAQTTPQLDDGFEIAPWLLPRHPRHPLGMGSGELGGIGLEWCGLRVGYDAALEPAAPPVEPGHWWERLRQVPASSLAIGGEADGVLFYDGSVDMPAPVGVRGAAPDRRVLHIEARTFGEYPDRPSRSELSERWWLSDAEREGARKTSPIPAVFVLRRIAGQETTGTEIESLGPVSGPVSVALDGLSLSADELVQRLGERLRRQGLTREEATSLVDVWHEEFFRETGTRVVTILPQWIYDALLPLRVYPVPDATVRVGLVLTRCDGLPVVDAAADRRAAAERWKPRPWGMPTETTELVYSPLPALPEEPLEWKEDGEIVLSGSVGGPSLSADGSRLAFSHLHYSTHTIYLADLSQRRLRPLWRAEQTERAQPSHPLISADGGTIAFWDGGGYLLDVDRERYSKLEDQILDVSEDGNRLLIRQDPRHGNRRTAELRVLDRRDEELRTVCAWERWSHSFVDLSDDGWKVAFVSKTRGDEEVYLADLAEQTILNVSSAAGDDDRPRLSHDGARVVFESHRDRDTEIYLADIERMKLHNLTRRAGSDRFPYLSGDGRRAVYRLGHGYYVDDLDGTPAKPIPATEHVWNLRIAAGGRRAVYLRPRKDAVGVTTFHAYVVDLD